MRRKGTVMKVFVAGATGVLGRTLLPQLVAGGHEVVGMTRSASKQDLVRSLGARPVVADALDPDAVAQAVAAAEPEVIVPGVAAGAGERAGCQATEACPALAGAPGGWRGGNAHDDRGAGRFEREGQE